MKRAYSTFEIKSVDEAQRIIEGIASTPSTDRMGDVVEPMGAKIRLPLPFLWQHGKDPFVGMTPVGNVISATPTKTGIPVRIQMARSDKPGRLKDILDFAWETISQRLVRAFSIGFNPLGDPEPIKGTFGLRFPSWEMLEISGVTIPANQDATITTIKQLAMCEKGSTPPNVSSHTAPVAASWSAPSLSDFTAQPWGTLSEAERRHIAGHFAWTANMPPQAFGDLKLPHHRASDGAVVLDGVIAAAGRLGQTNLPSADIAAVKAHLRGHYAQFNLMPPDSIKASAQLSGSRSSSLAAAGGSSQGRAMSPISEQLTSALAELKTKSARLEELIMLDGADGGLEEPLSQEKTALRPQVAKLSERCDELRAVESAQAQFVRTAYAPPQNLETRHAGVPATTITNPQPNVPPGIGLARAVICRMAAERSKLSPVEIAKTRYRDDPRISMFLKEDVPAGSTLDNLWASPLVFNTNLVTEFIDFLRPQTIIGRIPNLTRVPFHVSIGGQTTGSTGYWVGEGRAKPLSWFNTNRTTFGEYKVASIIALTEELARFSNPSAETLVRNEIAAACLERIDRDFIDPDKALVAGVSPASITNGVVNLNSAGNTLANAQTDLYNMLREFATALIQPTTWVMSNQTAMALSLMLNSLGQRAFPGITPNGGDLLGLPVVTSQYCILGTPANNLILLIAAPEIFLADDGGFTIDVSREASLEMNDAPTMTAGALGSPTGATGSVVVSMFQTNSIAIRCERYINWARKRSGAVVWMDDVNWAP